MTDSMQTNQASNLNQALASGAAPGSTPGSTPGATPGSTPGRRPSSTKIDHLTGVQKAAILLLSLEERYAREVLITLDQGEVLKVSQSLATLGRVTSDIIEAVYYEFAKNLAGRSDIIGSLKTVESLLSKTLPPDQVSEIMASIQTPKDRSLWEKLSNASPEVLSNFLKNEYPQTAALILSKLNRQISASVLSFFADDFALDVIIRMLKIESVPREIVNDIERNLHNEFIANLDRGHEEDNFQVLADIFNHFDRNTSAHLMQLLENHDLNAADRVKSLMFTFEDLLRLDDFGIQTLMRSVQRNNLLVALKGSPDLLERCVRNMSVRAGRILREDIGALRQVRIRQLEEAQRELVIEAKDLLDRGEIDLSPEA